MATDVSIAVSLEDKYSDKIKAMSQVSSTFDKDLEELAREVENLETVQDKYIQKISKLETAIEESRISIKNAKADYKELGDEFSKTNLEKAQADYAKLTTNLKDIRYESNQTAKAIRELSNDATSLAQGGGGSGSSLFGSMSSIANSMVSVGAAGFIGDAVLDSSKTYLSSAFGQSDGALYGNILSGATTGATMGASFGLPGIAAGAAIGTVTGAITGSGEQFAIKDDAFKSYVEEAVTTAQDKQDEMLSSGSSVAGSREMENISFTTLLGSSENADSFLDDVLTMANQTPFVYDELTSLSKTLLTYGSSQDEILPRLTTIGDTGSALSLSTDSINMVATALGRMESTDKMTLEYMNLLTERGIDGIGWLTERDGISTADVYDRISRGEYDGSDTVEFLLQKMEELYGGAMEAQSQTFSGLTSTVEGYKTELDVAMGEGFNETRKAGLEAEIDFLGGESGEGLQEAYSAIGAFKAEQENEKERLIREAYEGVINNEDYDFEGLDAVKQGELLMKAEIDAINEYNSTEGAELLKESELSLIQTVREDTQANEEFWNWGYLRSEEFSKGIVAGILDSQKDIEAAEIELIDRWGNPIPSVNSSNNSNQRGQSPSGSFAHGLHKVPFDGYKAILHKGERVLTEREANNYGASPVSITGNSFYIREEADIEKVASELARLSRIQQFAGG